MQDNAPPEPIDQRESAHTLDRKSARIPRIELITRNERRRRWTVEQKQTIAAQSLAPGASATEVARQHGIGTGLLYNWRKALLATQPIPTPGRFARVELTPAKPALRAVMDTMRPPPPTPVPSPGVIEIVLPTGTMLRVDGQIDPRALRRVLAALRG